MSLLIIFHSQVLFGFWAFSYTADTIYTDLKDINYRNDHYIIQLRMYGIINVRVAAPYKLFVRFSQIHIQLGSKNQLNTHSFF